MGQESDIEQREEREAGCLFCEPKPQEVLDENELCLTVIDTNPVSTGHCLIIPKRHAETYFDLDMAEVIATNRLLQRARERLMAEDATITGFNTGTNSGESAGQSIFHAHMHLIPRRDGDQENPRGGVRRIFPNKANYSRKGLPGNSGLKRWTWEALVLIR